MLTNCAKFPYFAITVDVIIRHDISFYVIIGDINKYELFSRYRIANVSLRQNNIFIAKTVYVLPRPSKSSELKVKVFHSVLNPLFFYFRSIRTSQ